jgi:hypothetical protein
MEIDEEEEVGDEDSESEAEPLQKRPRHVIVID